MAVTDDQTLDHIPVDQKLVEALYAKNRISEEARDFALEQIAEPRQWGVWVSRLLLVMGVTLVLTGVVFFFAYNWDDIPPFAKLGMIEVALAVCVGAAFILKLDNLIGKLALLSASILVGVFMAVFGQIYQTGADAYTLFMMWAILTLGWTLISNFSAQWVFWLVVVNIFMGTWWVQEYLPKRDELYMIYSFIILLNGGALTLREYFASRSMSWLDERWTRYLLLIYVFYIALTPIIMFIVAPEKAPAAILISAIIGFAAHGAAFLAYRYILPDIWGHAITILSICIILETAGLKILFEVFDKSGGPVIGFLLAGVMTLTLIITATNYLRATAKTMKKEAANV